MPSRGASELVPLGHQPLELTEIRVVGAIPSISPKERRGAKPRIFRLEYDPFEGPFNLDA